MPFDMRPDDVIETEVSSPPRAPTVRDVIVRAREIIGDKSRWTTFTSATDNCDRPVSWTSRHAVKFCAHGAIARACHEMYGSDDTLVTHAIHRVEMNDKSLAWTNDTLGWKAVIERLDDWLAKNPCMITPDKVA